MTLIYFLVTAHHRTLLWQYMEWRHLHSYHFTSIALLDSNLGGPQRQCGRCTEEKKTSALADNRTRIAQWSRLYSSPYPAIPGSNTYTVRYVNEIKLFLIFDDILAIFLYTVCVNCCRSNWGAGIS
jgi:hypothetical protein